MNVLLKEYLIYSDVQHIYWTSYIYGIYITQCLFLFVLFERNLLSYVYKSDAREVFYAIIISVNPTNCSFHLCVHFSEYMKWREGKHFISTSRIQSRQIWCTQVFSPLQKTQGFPLAKV